MGILAIFILLGAVFIGWTIGANDSSNCMGASVGAGIINIKWATIIVGFLAMFGAIFQGGATTSTVGKGIIDVLTITQIDIVIALFTAGILATVFTFFGLPISVTQSVIGAIAGIGIAVGTTVHWAMVGKIFLAGFATPIVALIGAFTIYKLLERILPKIRIGSFDKIIAWVVILSGAILAYTLGANNIGNAMGLVVEKQLLTLTFAGIIGGMAMTAGATMLGWKVMRTVSNGITELNVPMALAAQAGAAMAVYLLTIMAIPTSSTFAIVGGIAGVGLVKGVAAVDKKTLQRISFGWVATPLLAAIFAFSVKVIVDLI